MEFLCSVNNYLRVSSASGRWSRAALERFKLTMKIGITWEEDGSVWKIWVSGKKLKYHDFQREPEDFPNSSHLTRISKARKFFPNPPETQSIRPPRRGHLRTNIQKHLPTTSTLDFRSPSINYPHLQVNLHVHSNPVQGHTFLSSMPTNGRWREFQVRYKTGVETRGGRSCCFVDKIIEKMNAKFVILSCLVCGTLAGPAKLQPRFSVSAIGASSDDMDQSDAPVSEWAEVEIFTKMNHHPGRQHRQANKRNPRRAHRYGPRHRLRFPGARRGTRR